jgi:iron complex outermembrane receptor protein
MVPVLALGLMFTLPGLLFAADEPPRIDVEKDYKAMEEDLSLESLFKLGQKVTSVSGTAMDLWDAPAAVHVITGEDMKRRGNTSIAEALRFVPGLQVAQFSPHGYAIGSRGFASRYTANLLVLVDGRTVYTSLYSGTFWERLDAVLEDVDRIEVIRGPGATLWGANAVNGVINVVTKRAKETQGSVLISQAGTLENSLALRHGGQIGDDQWYRAYIKGRDYDDFLSYGSSHGLDDGYQNLSSGIKHEWEADADTLLTLQGDLYRTHGMQERYFLNNPGFVKNVPAMAPLGIPPGTFGVIAPNNPLHKLGTSDTQVTNANLMATLKRDFDETNGWQLKSYWDHDQYDNPAFEERRDTLDVDFRNWLELDDRNNFIWGVASRTNVDKVNTGRMYHTMPGGATRSIHSAFIQNTTELVEDRLWAMYGSKVEWNSVTGFEIQPSLRLTLKINDENSLWAAASRAVQTPGRLQDDIEADVNVPAGRFPVNQMLGPFSGQPFGGTLHWTGLSNPKSEVMNALELGWRTKPVDDLSIDSAYFYNDYEELVVTEDKGLNRRFTNDGDARITGFESHIKWHASEDLELGAGYTLTQILDFASTEDARVPQHMINGELHWTFADKWTIHTVQYWTSGYDANYYGGFNGQIDAGNYLRSDFGLSWTPQKNLDVAFWVMNAFDAQHPEMGVSQYDSLGEIPRSFLLQLTYRF